MREIEVMIDDVINKYGFEAKETLKFATLCETDSIDTIRKAYNKLVR